MQTILQDVRYALRQLRKSPGFAITAILMLALGIGATTAIFTLVYQVILRSIPVSHPEQLYKVGRKLDCCVQGGLQGDWSMFSDDLYRHLRAQTPGVAGIAAVEADSDSVSMRRADSNAAAIPLYSRFVSGNYFSVLGVNALAGRVLNDEDDHNGAPAVAVISYKLWQTKFAADPNLVGSTIMLSGQPFTVAGITAEGFAGERNEVDPIGLWIPLAQEPLLQPDRLLMKLPGVHWLDLLVRIPDSRNAGTVQATLQAELLQWMMANPGLLQGATQKEIYRQTTELASASDGINDLRGEYESSLRLLFLVSGFVLLIACANLANLMLVRGMARQRELSVRSALGATRRRLVRQMLLESILLSALGGAAAIAVAYLGARAMIGLAIGQQASPLSPIPSLPVFAFALAVSLLTGVLFGIAPAWITSRTNPIEALRGAQRSTRDRSALPQKSMVVLQAALSVALLSTAGLLITSLRQLERQDFHFETQGRMLVTLDLHGAGYKADQLDGIYRQLDDKFAALPGIQNFAYATYGPMTDMEWAIGVFMPGGIADVHGDAVADYSSVSANFFETVGTRILLGRSITEHDTSTSTHVAVVNQAFASKFFHAKSPIGEHFGPSSTMTNEYEIVGVVENTRYGRPDQPVGAMYFTPIVQTTAYTEQQDKGQEEMMHFPAHLIFRYRGDPSIVSASVRKTLEGINPDILILSMKSYDEQVSGNFTRQELVVRLTTLFGILALVLASIGLYGVTGYAVARRTSEIGIRMALGASRNSVLAMIVQSALLQAAIGLAIGLPLALGAGKFVQHTLYQTSAYQPLVLLSVLAVLLLASIVAAIVPARRAASIDPMKALRTD